MAENSDSNQSKSTVGDFGSRRSATAHASPSSASQSSGSSFFDGTGATSLSSLTSSLCSESDSRSSGDYDGSFGSPTPLNSGFPSNSVDLGCSGSGFGGGTLRPAAGMGQAKSLDKSPKPCGPRATRHPLKDSQTNYHCTVHLTDGEEKYWHRVGAFRLRSEEDTRAFTETAIQPPPNVTVGPDVCENIYWDERHRCQNFMASSTCPPSYGSHLFTRCSKTSSTPTCSSHSCGSKSGKIKEVLSSFVRSVLPSSRSSIRKSSSEENRSDRATDGANNGPPCPMYVNVENDRRFPFGQSPRSPSSPFDPPPSYESAVKNKQDPGPKNP